FVPFIKRDAPADASETIDPQLAWPRGGNAPSRVVDSIGGKAGSALMPIEAAAMRRVKAPSSRSARALRLGVRQLGINRLRSHDELAAEIEPAVPHLGLREEAVAFDLAAPAEVAHLQAACDECVGDEASMATPPRCLGAHQAWPLSRQRA